MIAPISVPRSVTGLIAAIGLVTVFISARSWPLGSSGERRQHYCHRTAAGARGSGRCRIVAREVTAEEETLAAAEQRIRSYSKRGIGSVKEMGHELIIAEKSAGLLDRRPDDPKKTAKCSAEF